MKRSGLPARRTPLRRASALTPGAGPSPRRAARAARDADYSRWRHQYLDGALCERCGARPATEVHHRRFRSAGGHLTLPANCARLCAACHRWVHDHPTAAHALGWIVRRGDTDWPHLAARPDRSTS